MRAHPENTLLARPGIRISVGRSNADLIGCDNRALQAAVDYVGALGGGTVEIGPGEYLMRDSLHMRSHVTVRGAGERTVLVKRRVDAQSLGRRRDFGEEAIMLAEPEGFDVGRGVYVGSDRGNGFHGIVATILNRDGAYMTLSRPLNCDCMAREHAFAATVFPVISAYDVQGFRIADLVVDGNMDHNEFINGCRGAGVFFYRGDGATVEGVTVRRFNGDGISFQQSNDVQVVACEAHDNAGLGLHPGSGSQRPAVRGCRSYRNGVDGFFFCWRVRHAVVEENEIFDNGRYGMSIGHKDTDNLVRRNTIRGNREGGDVVARRSARDGGPSHRVRRQHGRGQRPCRPVH